MIHLKISWIQIFAYISGWWFQPTPLKNDGVKVSWDDDIPNIWNNKKCSKPPTRFVSLSILCSMNLFTCKNNPPHATWMFVCNWSTTKFWLLRKLVVAMTTCHSWEDHHTISENPCHIVGSISHHTIPYPQIIIVPSRNSRFSIVLLPFFAVFLPQMDHVLHA